LAFFFGERSLACSSGIPESVRPAGARLGSFALAVRRSDAPSRVWFITSGAREKPFLFSVADGTQCRSHFAVSIVVAPVLQGSAAELDYCDSSRNYALLRQCAWYRPKALPPWHGRTETTLNAFVARNQTRPLMAARAWPDKIKKR